MDPKEPFSLDPWINVTGPFRKTDEPTPTPPPDPVQVRKRVEELVEAIRSGEKTITVDSLPDRGDGLKSISTPQPEHPAIQACEQAPLDDEPVSPELKALVEQTLAEMRSGDFFTHEEVMKQYRPGSDIRGGKETEKVMNKYAVAVYVGAEDRNYIYLTETLDEGEELAAAKVLFEVYRLKQPSSSPETVLEWAQNSKGLRVAVVKL